jgi:glycine betaine/proline transport system ATP-binding protein
MDEPFGAPDPLIRRQLQDEFIKLSAIMNKATAFITHDLDEGVRVGDRIAIMRDERLIR